LATLLLFLLFLFPLCRRFNRASNRQTEQQTGGHDAGQAPPRPAALVHGACEVVKSRSIHGSTYFS
jgi:hypothetical protein